MTKNSPIPAFLFDKKNTFLTLSQTQIFYIWCNKCNCWPTIRCAKQYEENHVEHLYSPSLAKWIYPNLFETLSVVFCNCFKTVGLTQMPFSWPPRICIRISKFKKSQYETQMILYMHWIWACLPVFRPNVGEISITAFWAAIGRAALLFTEAACPPIAGISPNHWPSWSHGWLI